MLSGLEAHSTKEIDRYLKLVDPVIAGKQRFDRSLFKDANGPVTAEQIYVNQKVSDLISKAEMEQNDYRRGKKPNVFFGRRNVISDSKLACLHLTHWFCLYPHLDCLLGCIGFCESNWKCEEPNWNLY